MFHVLKLPMATSLFGPWWTAWIFKVFKWFQSLSMLLKHALKMHRKTNRSTGGTFPTNRIRRWPKETVYRGQRFMIVYLFMFSFDYFGCSLYVSFSLSLSLSLSQLSLSLFLFSFCFSFLMFSNYLKHLYEFPGGNKIDGLPMALNRKIIRRKGTS